ncbi:MAG: hypothetical protein AVDCRST_MAG26-4093 [uncultured Chloroflexia bacterium]|uniref:Uncharacterized protein n=1 Tax=uncultured Chloroflexia bacterium TaxID=1672391 RepID=A0A6J4JYP2_9CHLR|nr:MAG: hypothetical protein AVDCRST_MAG26-4093 [uncultured Chloroflexia bacterium]
MALGVLAYGLTFGIDDAAFSGPETCEALGVLTHGLAFGSDATTFSAPETCEALGVLTHGLAFGSDTAAFGVLETCEALGLVSLVHTASFIVRIVNLQYAGGQQADAVNSCTANLLTRIHARQQNTGQGAGWYAGQVIARALRSPAHGHPRIQG